MKKSYVAILLVVFTGLMWIKTITAPGDNTKEYIKELTARAEQNEANGLYKPNIDIYIELISYEDNIAWYKKLKEAYKNLERMDDYDDVCEAIFEKYPDDEENTLELIRRYDAEERSKAIIELYNQRLSDKWKDNEEIKSIYLKYACKHQFVTSNFDGWKKSWNVYMLIKEDKYRYAYADGSWAFSNAFDEADLFIDDYAAVKNDGEWFFIDKEGDKYLKCQNTYDEVHSYSEGLAVVAKAGKYGYIDLDGKEYNIKYDYATAMYNGVAAVKEGNKWYIINSSLEKIDDNTYDDVIINDMGICSRKSVLFVKQGGGYKMVDTEGKTLSDVVYEDAKPFTDDGIAAVKKDGKWGFVDFEGNPVIDYQYEDADSFSCGFAPVKTEGSYEYIYLDGTVRTDLKLQSATQLNSNGYGVVSTENGYKVITFKICHVNEQ